MRNKTEKTAKKCLVCDSPRVKRGLCSKHYEVFRREKAELPLHLRAKFESLSIERGKILPRNQGGKQHTTPFSDIANELLMQDSENAPAGIMSEQEEAQIAEISRKVAEGETEFKKTTKKKA